MESSLVAFSLVAVVLVLTPGPDFAVVVPNAMRGRGIATTLGTVSGLTVHAAIAAAGLSVVILASDVAFSVVKYLGAAFLLFLGLRTLWQSRGAKADRPRVAPRGSEALPRWRAFRQGLLVNVLNPKAPLIYLSVMPQFLAPGVPAQPQLVAMSVLLVAIAAAWYLTLTALVHRLRPILRRFSTWIDRATGAVLVLLGVGTALQVRSP
ncbi:LysE family translocator [Homoserinibacter sp. YIM 151385]|uniref:LysE family translocator n=1 Tax=Homoserinibacter sp. YIM 151385 TaxID=2985506 RepID=UPI0022F12988|nr:LysE family translocator [Homoserinibacter sp. YIM 151385]WBU38805.1 LysE family translocator [Homoserinibacter sp. YIM 151385]